MSTEKLSRESIQIIIDRMMIAFKMDAEQQLAAELGYKKDALSVRKGRGTLPYEKIRLSCVDRGINYEWIITGDGEMLQTGNNDVLSDMDRKILAQVQGLTEDQKRTVEDLISDYKLVQELKLERANRKAA